MTFFFQTNPIGVILNIVLALLCSIIAVGGCFCTTVQETLNKAHASIIKCASHGSGAWIKASCSESMRFCKKNIHISNVINSFLSLPLTVVRWSRSGGWRRTYASRAPLRYASLMSLFTGAKEAKFPYFRKGKPVSSWLISKSSNIFLYKSSFCASNSWPVFCFVLSPRSSLITQRRSPTSSTGTTSTYHSQCLLRLKSGYFSYKNAWIRYRRPLFTPRSRVRHILLRMRTLYFTSSGLLTKSTRLPHSKAWRGQDHF